jgi:hypothetical protein
MSLGSANEILEGSERRVIHPVIAKFDREPRLAAVALSVSQHGDDELGDTSRS